MQKQRFEGDEEMRLGVQEDVFSQSDSSSQRSLQKSGAESLLEPEMKMRRRRRRRVFCGQRERKRESAGRTEREFCVIGVRQTVRQAVGGR